MKRYITVFSILTLALTVLASTSHASSFAAPVQVANTDTSPVPVRDVTNPTRKPFQISLFANDTAVGFVVPANKRFIIEQISGYAYLPSITPYREFVEVDTQISAADSYDGQISHGNHIFALTKPNATAYVLSNQIVKIHASAGTRVYVAFPTPTNEFDRTATVSVTLTGYVEDVN
jgi:hypothetical protein